MNTTRVYDTLPSDAGVTFEGFENIVLPTRSIVKNQLDSFISFCYSTNKSALRVLIGEWGEGKTDAFYRYLLPRTEKENHFAFLVSASSLANGYEIPAISDLNKNTPLSSLRFLTTAFHCINAENVQDDRIPDPGEFSSANEYIKSILTNFLKDNDSRIFIFIDEFEELLLNIEKLNLIISGIKETINGRNPLISEQGEFPGRIHFIVAATPDAFYRIQVSDDTALIFGGLGRRTGLIGLPPIRKKEGYEFLWSLLQYSYNYNLPAVTPIDNYGLFLSLIRITLGNPGNLVSKFTRLMNEAKIDDHEMNIIDGNSFIKFLEKETIFVYGGSTPCIESEIYGQILGIISDQNDSRVGESCVKIFKMLSSGIKPYSLEEIENEINRKDTKMLINQINEDIRTRLGIEKSIVNMSKLRDGKKFDDVLESFNYYVEKESDEDIIKIDNYSESLHLFEDRLLSFEIRENEVVDCYYLPSEKRSVEAFFEGIGEDKSKEIQTMITRRLTDDSEYFMISEGILQQIYPYPIPKELEFVKNRELRMKLWRDVTRNLSENYERYIMPALFRLLNQAPNIEIKDSQVYWGNYETRNMVFDNASINCLFYSVNGDVKSSDIDEIENIYKSHSPPILCTFLIYTGNITPSALDSMEFKYLGETDENIIFKLHLHPTLTKKILSIYRAVRESTKDDDINKNLLDSTIKRMLSQDLNFNENYDLWLETQYQRGIIIDDLKTESTINLRDLFDALKFYINYSELMLSPTEFYTNNIKELGRYIFYNSRIGLIPDIDEPKFHRLSMDLLTNLLITSEDGKYGINLSKIESNILKILENKHRLNNNEIESHFIIKKGQLLQRFYLPILEFKGLIEKEGNNYILKSRSKQSREIELTYRRLTPIFMNPDYNLNGYIYMKKQRDEKLILLNDYYGFLQILYNTCKSLPSTEENTYLQKCELFLLISEHFEKEFLPLLKNTNNKLDEILIESTAIEKQFTSDIQELSKKYYRWLKLQFEYKSVEEYIKLKKKYDQIENSSTIDLEYIQTYIEELNENEKNIFNFRHLPEDAFNFNPKQYIVSNLYKEIKNISNMNLKKIQNIFDTFNQFEQTLNRITRKLSNIDVNSNSKISIKLLELVRNLIKDILPKISPVVFDSITLDTLTEYLTTNKSEINKDLLLLESLLGFISKIDSNEKQLNELHKKYIDFYHNIDDKYDVGEYIEICKKFNQEIKKAYSDYIILSESIKIDDLNDIMDILNIMNSKILDIRRNLNTTSNEIQSSWINYRSSIQITNSNIQLMTNYLKEKYDVDLSEVSNISLIIEQRIKNLNVFELNYKISEINELVKMMRESFYDVIKQIMSNETYQVLEATINIIRKEKQEWVITKSLFEKIQTNTNLNTDIIKSSLNELIIQGFFKEGISLSI